MPYANERDHALFIARQWLDNPPDMMGDPDCQECIMARQLVRACEALGYVNKCLDQLCEMQSHYAALLNQYDGGKRMTFQNGDAWMTRLRFLESKNQERDRVSR